MTPSPPSAVVTGASSGIGQAIAIALADSGVTRLLVHYRRNREGAEQTMAACRELGCEVYSVAADLSSDQDRSQLVETAFDQLGSIQTWVNNAGADVLTGDAAALDFDAKLRRLMDVDVIGSIQLSRMVVDRLRDQVAAADASSDPPSLVFVSWDQAGEGMEGDAGQMFAPVKAAVAAYATSLAQEVAPQIRVNTVAPGWIETSWGKSTDQYWQNRAKQQALMNRWGRPEDVAKAVVYIADPNNTFLTGQTIAINGGWNRTFQQ